MKFKIKVRGPKGNEWWEEDDREVGSQIKIRGYEIQPVKIRGYEIQPEFTGDIDQWGRDIVAWYNKSEPPERHRTFIKAEMI